MRALPTGSGHGVRGAPCGRRTGVALLGLVVLFVGGCGGIRNAKTEQAPLPEPSAAGAVVVDSGEFTVFESMNDTWNTVGQVLVRLDGVTYESRAQMLGIHAVHYHGERMLIRTQAVVMRDPADRMRTRVLALKMDGKPNGSPAAIELLDVLSQRVPLEIGKYRQPIRLKKRRGSG